jgi:hypothetical protein
LGSRAAGESIRERGLGQARARQSQVPSQHGTKASSSSLLSGVVIQPKLTVRPAGDRYEKEADRVATEVVKRINSPQAEQLRDNPRVRHLPVLQKKDMRESRPPTQHLQIETERGKGDVAVGDLEAEINRARGKGKTLDKSLQRSMGQAMRADFSGVRVHTDAKADQLNQSIQSQAFTTGKDVFFRQGAYQPGSKQGQELIAHELTHVAQQDGGNQVIQRAVGFEFETNYKVERKKKNFSFKPYQPLKKAEVIEKYKGFRMEADERSGGDSVIEFVVDPPVAENQRQKLADILLRLYIVGKALDELNRSKSFQLNEATKLPKHEVFRITPSRVGLLANPQVTGGVSYDKLITLLSEIGGGKNNAPIKHQQAASDLVNLGKSQPGKAASRGRISGGSAKFQGLIAFLTSYILFGKKRNETYPPLNYAKLISNEILLRTDFGSMFQKLDSLDRYQWEQQPNLFVARVLISAGLDYPKDADIPVLERGVRKSQDTKSKNYNKLLDNAATRLTRREWLIGITKGQDLLSSYHVPKLKDELEGLGALGPKTDYVGDDSPFLASSGMGIIMEFRNMKRAEKLEKWMPLALRIFDYIVALNKR